ncbi:MAG TPA: hypothetical protein VLE91_02700 [Candidatus Saccharimonadales bacterium]|nr:hypothetical protein [Candidatus Saccharimonadales bacterium]
MNRAFTYLTQAFRNNAYAAGWFDSLDSNLEGLKTIGVHADQFLHSDGEVLEGGYENEKIYKRAEQGAVSYEYRNFKIPFVAPISEYGRGWAERLLTAAATNAHASIDPDSRVNVLDEITFINDHFEKDLNAYAFYRSTHDSHLSVALGQGAFGPHLTLLEAHQSTLFAAGFMTAYKVSGYENSPGSLLADLAKHRMFSKLALSMPPHVTANMGTRGYLFTKPTIIVDETGNLALRPDIVNFLAKHENKGHSAGASKPLNAPGCPVGRVIPGEEISGVDIQAGLFARTVAVQERQFLRYKQSLDLF